MAELWRTQAQFVLLITLTFYMALLSCVQLLLDSKRHRGVPLAVQQSACFKKRAAWTWKMQF